MHVPVCVCSRACIWSCPWVHLHVEAKGWQHPTSLLFHSPPYLLFACLFLTDSLTPPGAHWLNETGWPGNCLSPTFQHWGHGCILSWLAFRWVLDPKHIPCASVASTVGTRHSPHPLSPLLSIIGFTIASRNLVEATMSYFSCFCFGFLFYHFSFLLFWDRISCSPDLSWTSYVAQAALKLLTPASTS